MAATISMLSEESPLGIGLALSVACQLVHRLDAFCAALLTNDKAVFDAQHAIGKWDGSGVVGDGEHGAARVFGDFGEQLHYGHPVLAVERRRRLVGKHDGGRPDAGAGTRDPRLVTSDQLYRTCHTHG